MLRNIAVRSCLVVFSLVLAVGCSSSKREPSQDEGSGDSATALTAQDLLENCVTADLPDFAAILDVLQNLLAEDAELPQPELDLLRLIIDGTVGFSLDADQDGTVDISGSFGFENASGQPTIPVSAQVIQDIISRGDVDLQAILDGLPAGTTFKLDFDVPNIPGSTVQGGIAPAGSISFAIGDNGLATISGAGSFSSGDCTFDFDFSDIGDFNTGLDGFPVASLGFDLSVGNTDGLGGSIDLDGTNNAIIRAVLDGGLPEFFNLDLETGSLSPSDD